MIRFTMHKIEPQVNNEGVIFLRKYLQVKNSVLGVGNYLQIQLHMQVIYGQVNMKRYVRASTGGGVRSLTLTGTHTINCYVVFKID